MKVKTRRTSPTVKDDQQLTNHLADITEDLYSVINGGLTMGDANLPFFLYKTTFTSGVAKEVSGYGASVIFSDSPVTKVAYRTLNKNLLSVTLELESSSASVTLLVIKELPP